MIASPYRRELIGMNNQMSPVERFERALGYKIDGRYPEAVAELRSFLVDYPIDADAHHQLGLILGFTGEFNPSLTELRQAVSIAPENPLYRNDLALTYTMLGMYEDAKEQFARVLENDRENQTALRNLTYFE